VGYPILDLENFFTDIHKYLRWKLFLLQEYGIVCRGRGETGVWLDAGTLPEKFVRWAFALLAGAMHGFALNVNADLGYFDNIIPCGIRGKAVLQCGTWVEK
jgi:lipoyl(octanoyl) transferase